MTTRIVGVEPRLRRLAAVSLMLATTTVFLAVALHWRVRGAEAEIEERRAACICCGEKGEARDGGS